MKRISIFVLIVWGQMGFANGSSLVGSAIVPGMGLYSLSSKYEVAEDVIVYNPNKPKDEITPFFFVDPDETVVMKFRVVEGDELTAIEKSFVPVEFNSVSGLEGVVQGQTAWVVKSARDISVMFVPEAGDEQMTSEVLNRVYLDSSLIDLSSDR